MVMHERDPNMAWESPRLSPGSEFHPTDEELVGYYLTHKVLNANFVCEAIGEMDFNRCEPSDFQAKAKVGHQNSFYFFSLRDREYSTGPRTNRATEAGRWKATGKEREVMIAKNASRVRAMKRTRMFYKGRARTNWIMHEYRLEGEFKSEQQEWVVRQIFERNISSETTPKSYNARYDREYTTLPGDDSLGANLFGWDMYSPPPICHPVWGNGVGQ